MSVEQGAFIGSVFLAVFLMALEARVYDRLAGKAVRPECHRFVSINRLQAILKHVLTTGTLGANLNLNARACVLRAVDCRQSTQCCLRSFKLQNYLSKITL